MRSNRFGIPGVISVIALVFAMVGGAYAAKKYVITSTNQIKPSVLKAISKPGPKGDTGAKGDNGSAGASGPAGAKGDAGSPGGPGANGTSVTTKTFAGSKGSCTEGQGGLEVTSASGIATVCNGAEGEQGQTGQPWTPDNALPAGATETGSYFMSSESGTGQFFGLATATISIPIPLKNTISEANTIFVLKGTPVPAACKNEAHAGEPSAANPEASPGVLCVYESEVSPSGPGAGETWEKPVEAINPAASGGAVGTTGTILIRELPETKAAGAFSYGTWAVTGAP